MASQTTNYHLNKPAYTDTADIAVINGNMDTIDGAMKDLDDQFKDHWGKTYGSAATPVTSLADLPVNGGGYAVLDESISPTGTSYVCSFEKMGTSARYTVKATRLLTGDKPTYTYEGKMMDGVFSGWMRLSNAAHESWTTSITVNNCIHAFVLIGHRFRVTVWLPGDTGIDISVDYFDGSGIHGFYKESATNSITFGGTGSDTILTITRSGKSFTMQSTDNITNRAWTVFQY